MLSWQLLISYIERFRIHSDRSEWIRVDSEVSQLVNKRPGLWALTAWTLWKEHTALDNIILWSFII